MTHNRTAEEITTYHWLISPDGRDLLSRIDSLTQAGTPDLRIAERLRAEESASHVALAMTQRDLRRKAASKFPGADSLFFTREGLEQSTASAIARHRAGRFHNATHIADLCCGIGGDLMALSQRPGGGRLTGVDLDPVHLLLAQENVSTLSPKSPLTTIQSNVRDIDLTPYDAAFIDPARRSASGRYGGITSEPPLEWAFSLVNHIAQVGIKTAPGLPRDLVPAEWELETIALGSELKEAVLWSPALANDSRTATVIDDAGVHQFRSLPGAPIERAAPATGQWLLDPNPAITRAGLVADLARHLNASMIDDDIAFLITDRPVATPFARILPVVEALPWHEKRVKARLRELNAGPVDVRRRGLAGNVDQITARLRGKGTRRLVIAMTRIDGEPSAIICDIA